MAKAGFVAEANVIKVEMYHGLELVCLNAGQQLNFTEFDKLYEQLYHNH